jgi:hypothetical protein
VNRSATILFRFRALERELKDPAENGWLETILLLPRLVRHEKLSDAARRDER